MEDNADYEAQLEAKTANVSTFCFAILLNWEGVK